MLHALPLRWMAPPMPAATDVTPEERDKPFDPDKPLGTGRFLRESEHEWISIWRVWLEQPVACFLPLLASMPSSTHRRCRTCSPGLRHRSWRSGLVCSSSALQRLFCHSPFG